MSIQPLLSPVAPAGSEDQVQAIFAQVEAAFGVVPAPIKLYALSPVLLQNFVNTVGYFHHQSTLSAKLLAMIRYLVSDKATCHFCIDFNEAILSNLGADLEQVRAAKSDVTLAPLSDAEKILLNLAVKAVENPEEVTAEDLEAARAAGFSDQEIFEAVVQGSNNRALNLLLKAFKVETLDAFV